jgi:hypothetical protein
VPSAAADLRLFLVAVPPCDKTLVNQAAEVNTPFPRPVSGLDLLLLPHSLIREVCHLAARLDRLHSGLAIELLRIRRGNRSASSSQVMAAPI